MYILRSRAHQHTVQVQGPVPSYTPQYANSDDNAQVSVSLLRSSEKLTCLSSLYPIGPLPIQTAWKSDWRFRLHGGCGTSGELTTGTGHHKCRNGASCRYTSACSHDYLERKMWRTTRIETQCSNGRVQKNVAAFHIFSCIPGLLIMCRTHT